MITEIKYHRQQVGIIKSEKETLESVLSMKIDDVKKTVKNEESRYESLFPPHINTCYVYRVVMEMDRNRNTQRTEGNRLYY